MEAFENLDRLPLIHQFPQQTGREQLPPPQMPVFDLKMFISDLLRDKVYIVRLSIFFYKNIVKLFLKNTVIFYLCLLKKDTQSPALSSLRVVGLVRGEDIENPCQHTSKYKACASLNH